MKHLVFLTPALAAARSTAEAKRRGAGGTDDTTQRWWEVVPYGDGRAAVAIGNDTTGLSAAEILLLVPAPEPVE